MHIYREIASKPFFNKGLFIKIHGGRICMGYQYNGTHFGGKICTFGPFKLPKYCLSPICKVRTDQWQAGQQTWSCGTVDQSLTSELLNVVVVPINFINRQEDGIEYLIIEDCDENPYTGIRTTSSSRKITFHEHTFSFGGVHEVRHRHGVPFEEK